MIEKLGELAVKKSADYYDKIRRALEDAGFIIVLDCETITDRYYIVASKDEGENNEKSIDK